MRKPVVLITGASGEIGHGLIDAAWPRTRPAGRHPRPQPARAGARRARCGSSSSARSSTRSCSTASSPSTRSTASSTWRRCSPRAASSRPMTAHKVNVEGTLNMLEFAQKQGESHGRPVVFLYPSSIAAYGLPDLATQGRRPAGCRRTTSTTRPRCTAATSCTASSSAATTRGTTSSSRPSTAGGQGGLPLHPVPGPDLGRDDAVRRHVRLRPGDDPRGGAGRSRTPASSGRTRASRSWPCRTRSTRSCGWRPRRGRS